MSRSWSLATLSALIVFLLAGCVPSAIDPPKLSPLSAAERAEQDALTLERARAEYLGDFPDVELPTVNRIRYITNDEWPQVMATCLTEAGFAATVQDGGLSTTAPDGQELPFGLAAYTCSAQYPVNPREMMKLSADQVRYIYDYYTRVAIPCLENLGYTDLPEPPSKQSFIDSYPGTWDPYGTVSEQSDGDEWAEANRLCPQTPAGLYG